MRKGACLTTSPLFSPEVLVACARRRAPFFPTLSRPHQTVPRPAPFARNFAPVAALFLSLPAVASWPPPGSLTTLKPAPSFFGWCPLFLLGIRWPGKDQTYLTLSLLGPVVRSMVSANHWLSSIKINRLSCYLTLVGAHQASSNSALESNLNVCL